jgi:hypothetical protein
VLSKRERERQSHSPLCFEKAGRDGHVCQCVADGRGAASNGGDRRATQKTGSLLSDRDFKKTVTLLEGFPSPPFHSRRSR